MTEEIAEKKNPVCSVVIPMFNEEEVIGETYKRMKAWNLAVVGEHFEKIAPM